MLDCGQRLGLVVARPFRVHGVVHCADDQLGRVAELDRDDVVALQVSRGEDRRKTPLAEATVDAITPVDCQVNQIIEIRLVGLGAMRTEGGERRKFTRTARAQIHYSTPSGRKVGRMGISKGWAEYRRQGDKGQGEGETRRQGEGKIGRLLIAESISSPLPLLVSLSPTLHFFPPAIWESIEAEPPP